ncbi:MAG: hypothetical protein DME59_20885 [Verrucomicrobia bacterium]|nr:MAG: hypothetical protein DME59_20885 [Verrucomicrobiota bacterium]
MGAGESQIGCAIRCSSADELRNFSLACETQSCTADCVLRLIVLSKTRDLLVVSNWRANLTYISNYRIRVGNYRIVYQVNDPNLTVLVLAIAHRSEIYRR